MTRAIQLLGFFGDAKDAELSSPYEASLDVELANAAFETRLRLTDPLLLARGW